MPGAASPPVLPEWVLVAEPVWETPPGIAVRGARTHPALNDGHPWDPSAGHKPPWAVIGTSAHPVHGTAPGIQLLSGEHPSVRPSSMCSLHGRNPAHHTQDRGRAAPRKPRCPGVNSLGELGRAASPPCAGCFRAAPAMPGSACPGGFAAQFPAVSQFGCWGLIVLQLLTPPPCLPWGSGELAGSVFRQAASAPPPPNPALSPARSPCPARDVTRSVTSVFRAWRGSWGWGRASAGGSHPVPPPESLENDSEPGKSGAPGKPWKAAPNLADLDLDTAGTATAGLSPSPHGMPHNWGPTGHCAAGDRAGAALGHLSPAIQRGYMEPWPPVPAC